MEHAAMKPAIFYILLTLAGADSYGYAIMQAVREQSNGRVPLRTGSFYRHIARLIDDGLVSEAPAPRISDPRRSSYYRLTPRGRRALASEQRRLAELLSAMEALSPAARKGNA
jgi:DNA-binding PadR family transcriptional regulator